MPGVDELLIVDTDAARAAAVAESTGASPATEPEAIDAADAVVVATPAGLHAASVEAAVARGRSVLCEKPLTDDLASSRALVALAERAGAHVEVGFQRRHDAAFAAARRQVADGSAGRVHLLRLTALDPAGPPRLPDDWPQGELAPIFLHSSVHDFDVARWMCGSEVTEVTVDGSGRDGSRPDDPRGLETAVIAMRLASGALAVLEASWLHPGGYDIRGELLAERVHLTMGLSPRTPAVHEDWPGGSNGSSRPTRRSSARSSPPPAVSGLRQRRRVTGWRPCASAWRRRGRTWSGARSPYPRSDGRHDRRGRDPRRGVDRDGQPGALRHGERASGDP
jgi:myo-inositol 2-dehydrogenase/D-chiro-inositol 1-dehydrogenase